MIELQSRINGRRSGRSDIPISMKCVFLCVFKRITYSCIVDAVVLLESATHVSQ